MRFWRRVIDVYDEPVAKLIVCEGCSHAFDEKRAQYYKRWSYGRSGFEQIPRCPNCRVEYDEFDGACYWKRVRVDKSGKVIP